MPTDGEPEVTPPGRDDDVRREVVHARGHEHVSATHASTLEVTSDDWLTPAGDCILAVDADRTPADFDPAFRDAVRDPDATITCTLTIDPEPNEDGSAESAEAGSAESAEAGSAESAEDPTAESAEDVTAETAEDVTAESAEDVTAESAEDVTAETAESDVAEEAPVASVTITGSGHPDLELTNDRSMVARTATYVDDRTIMVDADAAADDVDRDLARALADGAAVRVVLEVES